MRVVRGRKKNLQDDRELTNRLISDTSETREPVVRVWRPYRQLAFGPRDARSEGFKRAKEAARKHGFEPVVRIVGGNAVAYTGNTVTFATTQPIEDMAKGLTERYEDITTRVQRALWDLGVPAQRGEPPNSFCEGDYSLQYNGKIVGIAQRVRKNVALVSGLVITDGHEEIRDVLRDVYNALGVDFDPDTVGSIERAGGNSDPGEIELTIESHLVDEEETTVAQADEI
ncbi:MAG: lipoate--protein ligase family protein [Halobacteria archaeon]|nr:lipoate--protein ligase family protein [Halobacteria archaeon]